MMMMMDDRRRDHLISSSYCSFACVYVQSMHGLSNKTRVEQIATFISIWMGHLDPLHRDGRDIFIGMCLSYCTLSFHISVFSIDRLFRHH